MITCSLLIVACGAPQAKTFTSRSGETHLEVVDMGDGTSGLTLRDSGGQRWARKVEHSLSGAYVCEDGIVVAHGIKDPKDNRGPGSLALTILGPTGDPKFMELHPILFTVGGVGPRPNVHGLLVWESIDTCAFWIEELGNLDQLWTFGISGARERVIEPETLLARAAGQDWDASLMEARLLSGTDLFLATFWCRSKMQGKPGSLVSHNLFGAAALLNTGGELLWWKLMPNGEFLGNLREVSNSKDEHRWEVDVTQVVEGRQQRPKRVGLLPLRFLRDADGVWRER